jgi:diguanylate cyclase (GGDEF)-like protein/PAS domain S-box-containing protein
MTNNVFVELVKYLKSILYDVKIDRALPEQYGENLEIIEIEQNLKEIRRAVNALGNGELSYEIKGKGYLLGTIKNLQASLRNLTWKTKAISNGDFTQKVDFLGEFSEAFNNMTEKLKLSTEEARESKEHFERIFNTIPDATLITDIETGDLLSYNKAFLYTMKFKREELEDKAKNVIGFYINEEERDKIIKKLKEKGYCENVELMFQRNNGEIFTGLVSSKLIEIKGKTCVLSVVKDITYLKAMENKLRESEERHRLLADHASDVIWTMDIEGKFTYVSPSVEKLRGYTPEEVMKQSPEEVLCPDSLKEMQAGLEKAIKFVGIKKHFNSYRGELEQPCKSGDTVWTEATVSAMYNEEGMFIGFIGVSRDIMERKKLEKEIIKLSITDKMTQLYNRLKLDEVLEKELNRSKRTNLSFAVIMMDIDYFKSINDTYGHQVGDKVLIEMASLLKKNIRATDIVGRWGGEEFLMILPATDIRGGEIIAEKLRLIIEGYSFVDGLNITSSFGVAVYDSDLSFDSIISRADIALYNAKESGRSRVCIKN